MSNINYIPQYENLDRLERMVNELQDLTTKGNTSKNNIVNHVDDIIKKLNKENPDYNSSISYVEAFLQKHESSGTQEPGEAANTVPPKDRSHQEERLLDQNQRLKKILEEKRKLNAQTESVNTEYEEGIDRLTQLIQEKKLNDESEQIEYVGDVRMKIEKERQDEYTLFGTLLKNQDTIYKLNRVLIDSYKIFDEERAQKSSIH
jgi:predicted nuclease with TOPRIM domain